MGWVGACRTDCRSPEPFSAYFQKADKTSLSIPLGDHFSVSGSPLFLEPSTSALSHPVLAPRPTPTGHLLAGELVDALDVVADASIDTVGLGTLVALPGMS